MTENSEINDTGYSCSFENGTKEETNNKLLSCSRCYLELKCIDPEYQCIKDNWQEILLNCNNTYHRNEDSALPFRKPRRSRHNSIRPRSISLKPDRPVILRSHANGS